jgi:hypothetical protein
MGLMCFMTSSLSRRPAQKSGWKNDYTIIINCQINQFNKIQGGSVLVQDRYSLCFGPAKELLVCSRLWCRP